MTSIEAPTADWVTIPDLYHDPFPIYERLRAEGGVHWVPQVGRYLITSYQAVHETEMDQQTYSANEEGSLQIRAMGHSMLRRDDPEHYLERRAWQPVLRPGVVKRTWTGMFRRNAERYLDEMIAKGPDADLIWDFAAPYSAENLRQILGLHNAAQEDLQRWSQTLINATGNYADDPEVWAEGERSFDEVDAALDEVLPWHAANPNESLLSTLLRIPDYEMPMERIRANIKMTIGGGLNEPRDALGVAAWAMLLNPDQRAAATADPALWHTVFDESLRWIAPIGLYSRQVTRDTVLAGVALPAGVKLGICVLSANRDEGVWPDAARFDIRREVKPHLAFSKGVHVCLGAWVARAEVADVALPMLFERLGGLASDPARTTEIGGWVFRGMTNMPVIWDSVRDVSTIPAVRAETPASTAPDRTPRVAIVGSGPSGCFTAQSVRRVLPGASVEVFDQLPTPYGLVRYGVAADHQGTKSVARQFDKLFTAEGVRFRGNVRVGADVSLDALRRSFDAVVLATGLHSDAPLPVPGGSLGRVHGAGRITRLLNGHPDEAGTAPALGATVAIVGHGNVAVDIARLLSRDVDGLVGSDVADDAHLRMTDGVRTIHVLGRSPVASAKFDPVMVRELAGLPGIRHVVHGAGDLADDGKDARVDAVRSLLAADGGHERLRIEWWFGHTPVRIDGAETATALVVIGADGEVSIPVDDVITAVGFVAGPGSLAEPGAGEDVRIEPGLYVAGWLRRGPRGTIPDQRVDARALARTIAEDVASGAVGAGAPGLAPLPGETDFDGWRRIDLRERLGAAPGRERSKLTTRTALLDAARDVALTLPGDPAMSASMSTDQPVTILFATESGGAELVAQELERAFGEATDVRVRDLADTVPGDLDSARMHLVISATYGDGEVPTSARPFHEALAGADLGGLRYAVFGMGDRSYTKTYSRGSELIDEALAAAGAVRMGEYGRHDASGPIPAPEVALEWLQGVLAELAVPAAIG